MTATVIAFPTTHIPRPIRKLTFPAATAGSNGARVTCLGNYVTDPQLWDCALRVLIVVTPNLDENSKATNEVDAATCHTALETFARNAARLWFGSEVDYLRMIAVLEVSSYGAFFCTILLDVPEYGSRDNILDLALAAFADLVDNDGLPSITVSEVIVPSTEVLHLMGRTFAAAESASAN
jgi:hypothetical protein